MRGRRRNKTSQSAAVSPANQYKEQPHLATTLSWEIYQPDNGAYNGAYNSADNPRNNTGENLPACESNLRNHIAIPAKWMTQYLSESEVSTEPLYLRVATLENTRSAFDYIVFSGIDIINGDGAGTDLCVMPLWAMNKLGIDQFTPVLIDKVYYLEKIAYLKVKASTKLYAEWDGLREILENYLSTVFCICVGDLLYIGGVEFYVVQLLNADHAELLEGSLFETDVKVDFEVPIDLEHEEHIADLEANAINQSVQDEEVRIRNSRPTREQLAEIYERRLRAARKAP
jgi:hypothetical protein